MIEVLRGELSGELVGASTGDATAETTVLIKGSRFMRMERVVEALVAEAKPEDGKCS